MCSIYVRNILTYLNPQISFQVDYTLFFLKPKVHTNIKAKKSAKIVSHEINKIFNSHKLTF